MRLRFDSGLRQYLFLFAFSILGLMAGRIRGGFTE
jgi:hypothetical protein